jgi:hypothetical protein
MFIKFMTTIPCIDGWLSEQSIKCVRCVYYVLLIKCLGRNNCLIAKVALKCIVNKIVFQYPFALKIIANRVAISSKQFYDHFFCFNGDVEF